MSLKFYYYTPYYNIFYLPVFNITLFPLNVPCKNSSKLLGIKDLQLLAHNMRPKSISLAVTNKQ